MQTFIVAPTFKETAKLLDNKRLGKQRVETKQIILTNQKFHAYRSNYTPLSVPSNLAWRNHPAVVMWRGYETMLALYGAAMCKEWIARGYADSLLSFFENIVIKGVLEYPSWLTNPSTMDAVILTHQQSLVFKDPTHYSPLFPGVKALYGYYWPTP